jgi:hypothetical protein
MVLSDFGRLLELGAVVAGHRLSMTGPRGSQVQRRELANGGAGFVAVVIEGAVGNARRTTFVGKRVECVEAITYQGQTVPLYATAQFVRECGRADAPPEVSDLVVLRHCAGNLDRPAIEEPHSVLQQRAVTPIQLFQVPRVAPPSPSALATSSG